MNPDVVLLDLKLSTGSEFEGLSLCAKLSASHPGIGLLVLTTFLDEDLVVRAVHAGARGYVVKDVDTTELVRAIRAISAGDRPAMVMGASVWPYRVESTGPNRATASAIRAGGMGAAE